MNSLRDFNYKAAVLQTVGSILVALGLCLKGAFLFVQSFGVGWFFFLVSLLIGLPILGLAWMASKRSDHRTVLLVGFLIATFIILRNHLWRSALVSFVTDYNYADITDYVTHPGDITVLSGKSKHWVKDTLDTGSYLPRGARVLVVSYGKAVTVKVGNQSCESIIGKEQDCTFAQGGQLLLEAKGGRSQVYLHVINPEP